MSSPSQEMIWVWKAEPVSPSGNSACDAEDDWIYIDDKSSTLINDILDPELDHENPSRAQVASKLLEELDEWIKEEPLSDWLEEKVESLFDELPPECIQNNKPIAYPILHNHQNHNLKVQQQSPSTQTLLQEFETVLGDVEACHQIYPSSASTLTPPQSPPPIDNTLEANKQQLPIDAEILVTLQPALQNVEFVFPQVIESINNNDTSNQVNETTINKSTADSYLGQISGEWNAENVSLLPLAGDVASELAAVDEYVRSCAEHISPPSPVNSSNSSYLSSEDSVDDPDWINDSSISNKISNTTKQRNQKLSRHRHKPYSRSTEDRKNRKKEQNKNAATRYRQKKKQEIKEIVGEEQELMDHNKKLQEQANELKREIGYLKGLMRDLFKAKGLIN